MSARATLAAGLAAAAFATAAQAQPRTVVVLLFDGFPPAAVAAWSTPALDRMRREGASSDHMQPPFPSISLVSQATIWPMPWLSMKSTPDRSTSTRLAPPSIRLLTSSCSIVPLSRMRWP